MSFSERTQVLLTPSQRAHLERIAAERRISVGALIREAIDAHLGPRQRLRSEALESLVSLGAPIADWSEMKRQIEEGALG